MGPAISVWITMIGDNDCHRRLVVPIECAGRALLLEMAQSLQKKDFRNDSVIT